MDGNSQYPHDVEANTYEENGTAERVSVKQLQRLVHLLDGSDVSEIEVKCANTGMHLVLRKAKAYGQMGAGDYQMTTSVCGRHRKCNYHFACRKETYCYCVSRWYLSYLGQT